MIIIIIIIIIIISHKAFSIVNHYLGSSEHLNFSGVKNGSLVGSLFGLLPRHWIVRIDIVLFFKSLG